MLDDVPGEGESDDDHPLINPTGLSTKKPDDGERDRIHRETTAFTDTPRVDSVPGKSPPPAALVLSMGQILLETVKLPNAEKIFGCPQVKEMEKAASCHNQTVIVNNSINAE